jgi:maleylacetoacetate isomerase
MKLYTHWRSQASFRVRIALRLKGLVKRLRSICSRETNSSQAIGSLNPGMVVPTLLDGEISRAGASSR